MTKKRTLLVLLVMTGVCLGGGFAALDFGTRATHEVIGVPPPSLLDTMKALLHL